MFGPAGVGVGGFVTGVVKLSWILLLERTLLKGKKGTQKRANLMYPHFVGPFGSLASSHHWDAALVPSCGAFFILGVGRVRRVTEEGFRTIIDKDTLCQSQNCGEGCCQLGERNFLNPVNQDAGGGRQCWPHFCILPLQKHMTLSLEHHHSSRKQVINLFFGGRHSKHQNSGQL